MFCSVICLSFICFMASPILCLFPPLSILCTLWKKHWGGVCLGSRDLGRKPKYAQSQALAQAPQRLAVLGSCLSLKDQRLARYFWAHGGFNLLVFLRLFLCHSKFCTAIPTTYWAEFKHPFAPCHYSQHHGHVLKPCSGTSQRQALLVALNIARLFWFLWNSLILNYFANILIFKFCLIRKAY